MKCSQEENIKLLKFLKLMKYTLKGFLEQAPKVLNLIFMSSEFLTQSKSSEFLDSNWYSRFEQLGSFQAYEYLDGDKQYREEQKQRFLNQDIRNPVLDYPKIDIEKLRENEKALLQLKKDIIAGEPNEIVKQVYRWRLNEKIAELRMLIAVVEGDANRFMRYSEFIYGAPSLDIFSYTIQNLRKILTEQLSSTDPNIRKATEDLINLLPSNLTQTIEYDLPLETDIINAREKTLQELGGLINIGDDFEDREYSANEIRDIFQGAIENLRAEGWQVVVTSNSKASISVDQEHKIINIPETRKLFFSKMKALVAHEIGTHVARRLNGQRSKLRLLSLGFDRYEKGEEGVATMREQVLSKEIKNYSGLEGHLATGLAMGLDGIPRDFRDVYEIMEKYFYFQALLLGKNHEDALLLAQKNAWNRTVRTFRGTDCQTKGVCFTKDIVYREGNIGVWEVVRESPNEMVRFSVGKYDPTNERHLWVLNQLGISEVDLKDLEK